MSVSLVKMLCNQYFSLPFLLKTWGWAKPPSVSWVCSITSKSKKISLKWHFSYRISYGRPRWKGFVLAYLFTHSFIHAFMHSRIHATHIY